MAPSRSVALFARVKDDPGRGTVSANGSRTETASFVMWDRSRSYDSNDVIISVFITT